MRRQPDSRVAEKFILGFEGTRLPRGVRELLEQGLAGVALYPRNFTGLKGLRALTNEIRRAAGPGVLIGIDQEGGTRFSLPAPFTAWPSATELGRLDDAMAVEQAAKAMAGELRAAGCNLNFAPMLDLALHPDSPVTRDRSFGADPQKVARLGAAFLRGLEAGGVLGCAKHFPGHGDTRLDPHEDLPVFEADAERLNRMEVAPFREAIRAGAPLVMTAHIVIPQIDAGRPASLSGKILQGILREQLGFDGVILADDLGMGAIRKRLGCGDAAVACFQAGSDVAMICHDRAAAGPAIDAVERARDAGQFDAASWSASHTRIERLRKTAAAARQVTETPPLNVVGGAVHQALAARIRGRIGSCRAG